MLFILLSVDKKSVSSEIKPEVGAFLESKISIRDVLRLGSPPLLDLMESVGIGSSTALR